MNNDYIKSKNRHPLKRVKIHAFKVLGLLFVFVLELLTPLNLDQAFAQANFYQGKTVRIVVGLTPGGFYDRWARMRAAGSPM